MTFEPRLIQVFAERLNLREEDILIPDHPETMVAYGAALSLNELFESAAPVSLQELSDSLAAARESLQGGEAESAPAFFDSPQEQEEFEKRHSHKLDVWEPESEGTLRVYLGIDSGSTTTKFVLMDEEEHILDSFYASNAGEPLEVARRALLDLRNRWRERGNQLEILALFPHAGCGFAVSSQKLPESGAGRLFPSAGRSLFAARLFTQKSRKARRRRSFPAFCDALSLLSALRFH